MALLLVAEDNEVNQQVAIAVLESMGCRVDAVANGQEALDQLERSSAYDLVFMDCQMPTMDGFTATRAIRAREADAAQAAGGAPVRRLPIVALTAHALNSDRQDCHAAAQDHPSPRDHGLAATTHTSCHDHQAIDCPCGA